MQFQCWQSIYWIDNRPVIYRSGRHECDLSWNRLPGSNWLATAVYYAPNRRNLFHGRDWILRVSRDEWENRDEEPVGRTRCHYKQGILVPDSIWDEVYRMLWESTIDS